ncbi:MAG: adenine deaminase [Acholeplasmataceae bacterium]|nr:MAG: adenine deaminase [Acholeplasmataceae bacterium]
MDQKALMRKARGLESASLVLKHAKIINVYDGTIEEADIAIEGDLIIGIGSYQGKSEKDLQGRYVAPGLIDGHVHIESSMVTPPEFARLVVPKGTTTVIADPHEIANVSGVAGIRFMLESSENTPLDVFMMLPSCVPATKAENSGAVITVKDIESLKDHPRVLGLGEVMDYPAVLSAEADIHSKIAVMKDRVIDGHAPDVMGFDLNAYLTAGVMTDHECTRVDSMLERIKRGMYVHLREGSATRNTQTLLQGVNPENMHRLLFCTDDKHPEDIQSEGHINHNVNLAIKHGIKPVDAIRMATLNAATCYGLKHLGGIGPGKQADLIVFEDLEDIQPIMVYKAGILVAQQGKPLFDVTNQVPKEITDTVRFELDERAFQLSLSHDKVHVIGLVKHNIITQKLVRKVRIKDGHFDYTPKANLHKLAVIERHKSTGNIGLGLVEGFGDFEGALAMTISHDSHNLVILGSSDADMMLAASEIKKLKGGIVLVHEGKVIDALALEVAGIMTSQSVNHVEDVIIRMRKHIDELGMSEEVDDPFISLAFLCLPVIPSLKLTDKGLFDVDRFEHISIEANGKVSS